MTIEEIKKELSDSEIMFLTIVGEARGEPIEGQVAVGNVIMNRNKKRKQGIKDVCLAPKQFSCWNEHDPNRKVIDSLIQTIMNGSHYPDQYKQIQWVVDGIIGNKLKDNIKGRDHYMTTTLFMSDKRPNWARFPTMDLMKIGNHTFFSV